MTKKRYQVNCREGCEIEADLSDDGLFSRPTAERRAGFHEGSTGHSVNVEADAPDDGREEPTRSEPADFGGGDTTGVQEL